MKAEWLAVAILLGSTVAAQAVQGGGIPPGSLNPGAAPSGYHKTNTPSDDPEGQAEQLRLSGRCDQAVPLYRQLSDRAGYEISQYHLGECLLTLADAEHDAAHAADERKEAAKWILRAANAGFAAAEAAAVALCLDGVGMEKNPVEAEKWALLYRHNSMRLAIGLPDIAPDVASRLDAALSESQRAQAESSADAWSPTNVTSADN
ncbi:MAG: hypothetical protein ABSD74_18725 [Rhizomicrobium sp.]|jgi:hypothetical protein